MQGKGYLKKQNQCVNRWSCRAEKRKIFYMVPYSQDSEITIEKAVSCQLLI
jgi:hypothetical protein